MEQNAITQQPEFEDLSPLPVPVDPEIFDFNVLPLQEDGPKFHPHPLFPVKSETPEIQAPLEIGKWFYARVPKGRVM